jgi:hypothetical protein
MEHRATALGAEMGSGAPARPRAREVAARWDGVGSAALGVEMGSSTPEASADTRGEELGDGTGGGWVQAAACEGEAGAGRVGGGVDLEKGLGS